MTTEAEIALGCMCAFVGGLVQGGVRAACVSPGSRSTPLALALARDGRVRVFVHLDERSSGFFALGLAKASGSPVVVACTSGTAAANLLPAIVEASMARVPLVALTADRPPELRGVGANQTIEQLNLFGSYVRDSIDAPVPGAELDRRGEPDLDAWSRRGMDAAGAALAAPPRPVHVNLPFREPLVPSGATEPAAEPIERARTTAGTRVDVREDVRLGDELAAFAHDVCDFDRGVVLAGGLRSGADDVVAIARALGWPLVAEPHSGARTTAAVSAGQLLIRSEPFLERNAPDVVLQIGSAPTSRAGLALIRRSARLLILDPDIAVADPLRRAARSLTATPATLLSALADGRTERDAGERWRETWRAASDRARSAVDALLDSWEEPFEGRVARDVAAALPDGADLCVGSSLPIRDLDLFMLPREGVRVLANRGASGIDGFVSTTLGVSAAGRPTVGLLGDLTLLHDVGGLVWNARRGFDAVLVVLDNGGGAIFSSLEQRALPEREQLFTTPHRLDLGAVVATAGAEHVRVERAGDLVPAIDDARARRGLHVVQVVIDAERDRRRREEITATVDAAIR